MLTPLIKPLVRAVFKLTDCGNGTELGSFVFVKNQHFIGFLHPHPDKSASQNMEMLRFPVSDNAVSQDLGIC
jgi:hypothetical protein